MVYKGRTPLSLTSVSPQSHNIELDLNGYYDWKTTVTVTPGVTTSYVNAQMRAIPSQTTGFIDVTSSPAEANIYLDGAYQGQTSSSGPFTISNVPVGAHTVRLTLIGYQDYTTSANVVAGTTSHVGAALQPPYHPPSSTGTVSVSSSPTGANVYIDNAYKGVTPVDIEVSPGTRTVKVTLPGYLDWSTDVQVTAGGTSQVSASLTPATTSAQSGVLPFAALGALAAFGLLPAVRRRD